MTSTTATSPTMFVLICRKSAVDMTVVPLVWGPTEKAHSLILSRTRRQNIGRLVWPRDFSRSPGILRVVQVLPWRHGVKQGLEFLFDLTRQRGHELPRSRTAGHGDAGRQVDRLANTDDGRARRAWRGLVHLQKVFLTFHQGLGQALEGWALTYIAAGVAEDLDHQEEILEIISRLA